VLAIAVGITVWLLPGLHFTGDIWTLFLMSAVLGLLMAVLKPILMLLTCPLVIADTRAFHARDQHLHAVHHGMDFSGILPDRQLLVGAACQHHHQRDRDDSEFDPG
jgi:hypothetical protein